MSFLRYAAIVLAIMIGSLGLVLPLLSSLGRGEFREPTLAGAALAALNTLAAYGLILWSKGRSPNVFLGAVLGGMVGRMGLMIAAFLSLVLYLGIPKVPLAFALLSYFVLFLVLELSVLNSRPGREA